MRKIRHEHTELDGSVTVTETPYTHFDYLQDIEMLEGMVTERRKREAILGVPGAREWLIEIDEKIEAIKSEMQGLANDR